MQVFKCFLNIYSKSFYGKALKLRASPGSPAVACAARGRSGACIAAPGFLCSFFLQEVPVVCRMGPRRQKVETPNGQQEES